MKSIIALGVVALSSFAHAQDGIDPTLVTDPAIDGPASTDPPPPAADPDTGCMPYFDAVVANAVASFPNVWERATILPGDINARARFDAIRPSIPPEIGPKGTTDGDFTATVYGPEDDDCWWTGSKCTVPKHSGIPADIDDVPEPSTVGYGFDDGPNCSHNAFYDYLAKQKQTASMFFIGSNVMNWPNEARRALTDGHEICIHSWSHHYMTGFENEDAFAELYYVMQMQAVKVVVGVTPTCWRPPFGDVDDRIRAIATGLGLRTIMWKYDSNDWQEGLNGVTFQKVDADYKAFLDASSVGTFNARGGVILAHELNNFTMEEAIKFYPQMKATFKNIVPMAVAYNITHPYVEQNYTFPTFEQYTRGDKSLVVNATLSTTTSNTATRPVASPTANINQGQVPDRPKSGSRLSIKIDFAMGTRVALSALVGGGIGLLL